MSTEGHRNIPSERLHRISEATEWDREQADTPLYSPDFVAGFMHGMAVVGWVLIWIAIIAVACGAAAWAGMAILQWIEPHWPRLVASLSPYFPN